MQHTIRMFQKPAAEISQAPRIAIQHAPHIFNASILTLIRQTISEIIFASYQTSFRGFRVRRRCRCRRRFPQPRNMFRALYVVWCGVVGEVVNIGVRGGVEHGAPASQNEYLLTYSLQL